MREESERLAKQTKSENERLAGKKGATAAGKAGREGKRRKGVTFAPEKLPPKYVEYTKALPEAFSFVTNAFALVPDAFEG